MTSRTLPADGSGGASTISVQDAGRVLEFDGRMLADISTETQHDPRWLEMELYKLSDGTERYVLHLVGRSVVYHERHSPCNRGVKHSPSDQEWPADAEACQYCKPMDWRDPSAPAEYDLEMDRHTAYVCSTADDVVNYLRESSRHQRASGNLSAPAQRLLDAAAINDGGVAAATTTVERL